MSLNNADVRRIARLARLAVTDSEVETVQGQLNGLLALIEDMRAVDTTGLTPMAHPQDVALRLREDVAREPNRREAIQAVAPQTEAGLYLVPKVIE